MQPTCSRSRRAFTLVEMLVAIAVFSLLLTVVLVPLRVGLDSFHVGKARSETQSASQATLDQIERDLQRAVYVFPNAEMPGITDKAPFTANDQAPYTKSIDATDTGTPQKGVCDKPTAAIHWSDTARIDMLLAKRDSNGRVVLPARAGDTVVTYYGRRQNLNAPYDPVDNPIVLFRAQFPFRGTMKDPVTPVGALNADTSNSRFPTTCSAAPAQNRSALWVEHNAYGEANLEPLCEDTKDSNPADTVDDSIGGSHTLAVPRGVGLVASQAYRANATPAFNPSTEAPLQPDASFDLSDTNSDGKIDRVAIALALETFDTNQGANVNANNQPTGQIVRGRRVVNLPNVR